ncbi:hypothetical protein [Pseudoalteromonas sp. S1612]|uniref:hypothetical protein n=1 Tax=Pseudoalteromonas sp. S1612 TaxID=579507 RepID=UPI00110A87D9|nr:hypothetical protein [Pseudoalteromonas sp. S1612]TMP54724.1 hypothetical protein CWB78_10595 [Pseudoalteromonas sp. S1612]
MFIFITLIALFFLLPLSLLSKTTRLSVSRIDVFLLNLLLFLFVFIFIFSIFVDLQGGINDYFPGIFINDAHRYLLETRLFLANPLEVNELIGSYRDYNVTPKMGLSSLLANLNIFKVKDKYFIYAELLCVSFLLCCLNYMFLKKLATIFNFNNSWRFVIAFSIFVCFPLEFYWKTRFLREVIVHTLLLGSILLLILSCYSNERFFSIFILYCLFILMFRAQLFLLVFLFAMIFYKALDKKKMIILLSISLFTFVQIILASGVSIFKPLLIFVDLTLIYSIFEFLEDKVSILYFVLVFCSLLFSRGKRAYNSYFPSFKLFITIFISIFTFILMTMDSIRFFYPVMLMSLVLLFFAFISKKIKKDFI